MLQTIQSIPIKKFLCLNCESRWEEVIFDELNIDVQCLKCNSFHILPFPESAIGQHGCNSTSCNQRINNECGNCKKNCKSCEE